MAEPNPSALPERQTRPVVEFAEWLPALGGSRLLRVHGAAPGGTAPALVLDTPSGEHRVEPRAQARFTRPHEWRTSYLIASEVVAAGWSGTTLQWPDGTRISLPEPSEPGAQVIDPTVLTTLRARRFPREADTEDAPHVDEPPRGVAGPEDARDRAEPSRAVAEPDHAPDRAEPSRAVAEPDHAPDRAEPSRAVAEPDHAPDRAEPSRAVAGPAASAVGLDPAASALSRSSPAAPVAPRAWTDPPDAFGRSVFEAEAVWTAKRAELERELARAAESIARAQQGEREAREAVLSALAAMRADLRAASAARAADADTIATLKAELEAERIAHAVTRRTASDLRSALAQARRQGPEDLGAALEAERRARAGAEAALRETREAGSALMERIAELSRARELDREALARHARAQAQSAAAATRRPEQETGELVANLAAAAASLRATAPPPEAPESPSGTAAELAPADVAGAGSSPAVAQLPAAELAQPDAAGAGSAAVVAPPPDGVFAQTGADVAMPAEPTTSDFAALTEALGGPPARPLRRVLVALAERDPVAAGELLVGLLPAQGPVFDAPVAYDLTVAGIGTFAVTVRDGVATIERVSKRRSRGEALFELRSDPLTLAELLAGADHRIGRFRGRARVSRRRRRARVLEALPRAAIGLADALGAGARLEPALVYKALPLAIDPEWTVGYAFTVAQEITDPDARTWYLAVRDGAGVEVSEEVPESAPDATVTMTRAAFERLLRGEPPDPAERPLVRGDRAAVAILKAWTDRARGAA